MVKNGNLNVEGNTELLVMKYKEDFMFSTEGAIIIPMVIILLIIALGLIHFAAVMNVFELDHSRAFMLDLLKDSEIDQKQHVIQSIHEVDQHLFYAYVLNSAEDKAANPFNAVIGPSMYTLKSRFYLFRVKRHALSLLKDSFEIIVD